VDARARRSRDRLFAAVLALAADVPVEQLSVTEVARSARVHRSTFYEHASTPDGLLRAALLAELDDLRADLLHDPARDTDAAVAETTRRVLEHVLGHLAVYRRGLADDAGAGGLHAMLADHFLGSSRLLLQQGRLALPTDVPGATAEVVADAALRLIALGTVGVIRTWITLPEPDVVTFTTVYARLVPDWWSHLDP
jgi:AcrR family transcriptional regulator